MRLLAVQDKELAAWLVRNASELWRGWRVKRLSVDDTARDMLHYMLDLPHEAITADQTALIRAAFASLDPHVWIRRTLYDATAYQLDLAVIVDWQRDVDYLVTAGGRLLLTSDRQEAIRALKDWDWLNADV